MTSTLSKIIIGTFVLIGVYLLLVYYKGGKAYVGSFTGAFGSGVHALQGSGTNPAKYA